MQMSLISRMSQTRKILIILVIFYAFGVFWLSFPPTKGIIETLTPYTLLMNLLLLMLFHKPWTVKHIVLFAVIAVSGFLVEVAGVQSGLVFGDYQYDHVLGTKIFGTPLIIGVNWLMLIYFVYHLTGRTKINRLLQIIAGALMMVTYDIFLEPVAIRMNMWNWSDNEIPVQNYVAWFFISIVFLSLLHIFKVKAENKISRGLMAVQAGFILSLNIIYRFI